MIYIHIAGTNGKGSVAEYLSNIIMAAGEKCACFTSPHLISPTERMRINGQNIDENALNELLQEVRENQLASNDSLFAAYTAAALLWFCRMGADYAVIETGLGGRLDPTNCVSPSVAILTPIDYDHTDVLGDRLTQIAQEKCGIIKPGVPVISAHQHEDVANIIQTYCKKNNCTLRFTDQINQISSTLDGQTFEYSEDTYSIQSVGQFQPQNAALAIEAAKELGFNAQSIKTGLKRTVIKGRTQFIKGTPNMLIDGAHNPASADMLVRTLTSHFADTKKVLLFACMKDKDYKTIINSLKSQFSAVVVTRVDKTRGEDSRVLYEYFSKHTQCKAEGDVHTAFNTAKQLATRQQALLVVCGSLYLAGYISSQI